jgi:hypothetical protein
VGAPLRALTRITGVLCGQAFVERLQVSLDKTIFSFVSIFPTEKYIDPGKIVLLEAIRAEGSILSASKPFGMRYRCACLLVREIKLP